MPRPTAAKHFTTVSAMALAACVSSLGSAPAWAQSAPPPPGFEPHPATQPPPSSASPTSASPTTRPTAPPPGPPVYGTPPAPPPYYGPETLEYDEDRPIPPGYHVESSVRKGLVIGGAVTFGAVYLINVLVAIPLVAHDDDFTPLYVPAAGPFVTMATEQSEGAGTTVLAIDGIVQTGGLLMLVLGLALQKEELVRDDYYEEAVRVEPMRMGRDGFGLGLGGTL